LSLPPVLVRLASPRTRLMKPERWWQTTRDHNPSKVTARRGQQAAGAFRLLNLSIRPIAYDTSRPAVMCEPGVAPLGPTAPLRPGGPFGETAGATQFIEIDWAESTQYYDLTLEAPNWEGTPMEEQQIGWIAAIIIGGIAGWLAEQFMKSEMGLLMHIVLGVIGAGVASWLLSFLGISLPGWIGYLIAGFIGACILIAIGRALAGAFQRT